MRREIVSPGKSKTRRGQQRRTEGRRETGRPARTVGGRRMSQSTSLSGTNSRCRSTCPLAASCSPPPTLSKGSARERGTHWTQAKHCARGEEAREARRSVPPSRRSRLRREDLERTHLVSCGLLRDEGRVRGSAGGLAGHEGRGGSAGSSRRDAPRLAIIALRLNDLRDGSQRGSVVDLQAWTRSASASRRERGDPSLSPQRGACPPSRTSHHHRTGRRDRGG